MPEADFPEKVALNLNDILIWRRCLELKCFLYYDNEISTCIFIFIELDFKE